MFQTTNQFQVIHIDKSLIPDSRSIVICSKTPIYKDQIQDPDWSSISP